MHERQMFARMRGGTIPHRYRPSCGRKLMDELGITVAEGTSFQLHRDGETGAFIITCRSATDAKALWHSKMLYFRRHPSH